MWLTHKVRLSAGEITVNDGIISERVATSRVLLVSTTVAAIFGKQHTVSSPPQSQLKQREKSGIIVGKEDGWHGGRR